MASTGGLAVAFGPSTSGIQLAGGIVGAIGAGIALPAVSALLAEIAPRSSRGRLVAFAGLAWAVGLLLTSVVNPLPAAVVALFPAAWIPLVRRVVPESPRYLAARGRVNEADALARRLERQGGGPLITVARATAPRGAAVAVAVDLLSGRLLRRTAALWGVWLALGVALAGVVGAEGYPFPSLPLMVLAASAIALSCVVAVEAYPTGIRAAGAGAACAIGWSAAVAAGAVQPGALEASVFSSIAIAGALVLRRGNAGRSLEGLDQGTLRANA